MHDHLGLEVAARARPGLVQFHPLELRHEFFGEAEQCGRMKHACLAVDHVDVARLGAEPPATRIEHLRGQLALVDRACRGCRDLAKDRGAAELVLRGLEQPGVLDRDRRMRGEALDEADLAFAELAPLARVVRRQQPDEAASKDDWHVESEVRGDLVGQAAPSRLHGVVVDQAGLFLLDRVPGWSGEVGDDHGHPVRQRRLAARAGDRQRPELLLPQADDDPAVAPELESDPGKLVEDVRQTDRLGQSTGCLEEKAFVSSSMVQHVGAPRATPLRRGSARRRRGSRRAHRTSVQHEDAAGALDEEDAPTLRRWRPVTALLSRERSIVPRPRCSASTERSTSVRSAAPPRRAVQGLRHLVRVEDAPRLLIDEEERVRFALEELPVALLALALRLLGSPLFGLGLRALHGGPGTLGGLLEQPHLLRSPRPGRGTVHAQAPDELTALDERYGDLGGHAHLGERLRVPRPRAALRRRRSSPPCGRPDRC